MAPLAGYTCYPFRILCQKLGAGLTFTEMASANGLRHHDHVATNIIFTDEREILSSDNFSQLIKVKRDDGTKIITPTSWLQNCGVENIYSKNASGWRFCFSLYRSLGVLIHQVL